MNRKILLHSEPCAASAVHLLKVNGRVMTVLPPKLAALLIDPYHAREFPDGFEIEVQVSRESGGMTYRLGPSAEVSGGASVVPFVPKYRETEPPLDGQ